LRAGAGTALLVSLIAFIAWLAKPESWYISSQECHDGFKCGVALFLASTQLPKLFGFHSAQEASGRIRVSFSSTE